MPCMSMSETEIAARLRDNLARVRERLDAATARAGRDDPPRLVAVTKYVEPRVARVFVESCFEEGEYVELAESRPQELWRKAEALKDLKISWHLIGHLQRNKVRRTLPHVSCIQSVDSLRLAEGISREAVTQQVIADVLLEVNISGDEAKHGLRPDEVVRLLPELAKLPRFFVLGLMTMASLEGGLDKARRDFAALRELKERLPSECSAPNIAMIDLSMGMSDDFEVAIEEGATIVRVGSALFEGIESS
jgi:PLP dependent protein